MPRLLTCEASSFAKFILLIHLPYIILNYLSPSTCDGGTGGGRANADDDDEDNDNGEDAVGKCWGRQRPDKRTGRLAGQD